MLMMIRGTAVLIRRLLYLALIVCLFFASAAIGAAYRDAGPNADWKSQLKSTLVASKQIFASAATQALHSVSGLASDLGTFVQDLRGNKTSFAKEKAAPKTPPADDSDEAIVVSVSSRGENELAVAPADGTEDPLKWLSQSEDCSQIHQQLMQRYGSAQFADEMEEKSRREEFRHVFREICSSPKFAKCGFELCSQSPILASAKIDTAPDEVTIAPELKTDLSEEEDSVTEAIERAKIVAEVDAEAEAIQAPMQEKSDQKLNIQRARMGREKISTPDEEDLDYASEEVEREISPPKKPTASAKRAQEAQAIVAQAKRPVPSDDALAPAEMGNPTYSRQKFGQEVSDEPDEYRAILRKGQNARQSVENSEGR